ncbi:hypothetical protein ACHAPC_007179 [Botrytis cinerea]
MTTAKESNKVVEETSKVHNVVSQFDGEGEASNLKASTVPESEDSKTNEIREVKIDNETSASVERHENIGDKNIKSK